MLNKIAQTNNQQGQTLVETMVAVFILVMGITAALGLAVYSFNATTLANKQVLAMGLAREGVEAVKNMRDTNWLKAITFDAGCNCYLDWKDSYYRIEPSQKGQAYTLDFNPADAPYWTLDSVPLSYRLAYDPDSSNGRFYYPVTNTKDFDGNVTNIQGSTTSDYYRRITIVEETSYPYDSNSPRLQVTADVWWTDKKCPAVEDFDQAAPSCRISLKTYLTNWKNF